MIIQTTKTRDEIIRDIPSDAYVLDIGGATEPFKRADVLMDIVPWEQVKLRAAKGPGDISFSKSSYIQHDICAREQWPIADKAFDYSLCSHVLEDIRDPLWVCSEIIRVSKAGYIEIPSRLYETTIGLEVKKLSGASHHRWLIDLFDGKLRFTFKYMHIHSKRVNRNKGSYNKDNPEMYLCLEWSDSFNYYENWLNSGKEIFEYYLDRPITEKEKWAIYRDIQNRPLIIRWLAYIKNLYRTIDTDSYKAHNSNFIDLHTYDYSTKIIKDYDDKRLFEGGGYTTALKKFTHRSTHIDIGTGIGWLLRKTSPLFDRVIGIEPSETAVAVSKEILKEYDNISHINKPMLEAFQDIPFDTPIFFTSSTVFSHISDFHVAQFLSLLQSVQNGSTLYFDENYNTNINHKLWRIRNKEWWAKNLPDWQLSFFDIQNDGYSLGIYGEKVGKENVTNTYSLSVFKKIIWQIQGVANFGIKVLHKITGFKLPFYKLK